MKLSKLLFFSLLSVVACQTDQEENGLPAEVPQKSIYSNATLEQTESDLVSIFLQQFKKEQHSFTISMYIKKLDSISQTQSAFIALQPADYQLISSIDAVSFLVNQKTSYDQLDVSFLVKNYLDALLSAQNERSVYVLLQEISTDNSLSIDEKKMLTYTVNTASITHKKGKPVVFNPQWGKRKIVGIVEGWTVSPANAVFNAALSDLYSME